MPYADKDQQRQYQLEWMHRRRQEFFSGRQCIQCGSADQLELDHVDPARKVDHRIWSWAKSRREAELAKCQALCKTCHRIKTDRSQKVANPCGTVTGYSSRKCRCTDCRAAWASNARNWRAKRRKVDQ